MSSYQKYFNYKMKYLNLKNKLLLKGGSELIYNKQISNIPIEYLQNIIFIIITQNGLNINDFNIKISQEIEKNINQNKTLDLYIYSLKDIPNAKIESLIKKLDEKIK